MGAVRMGPPEALVLRLRDASRATTFVETGTFMGNTTQWAASHFRHVVTVELSPKWAAAARDRFRDAPAVTVVEGHSVPSLETIVRDLKEPALFWLDSHWCGGATSSGESEECPLVQEIDVIAASEVPHVILIDDARYFLAPPPLPHKRTHWPHIQAIVGALERGVVKRYSIVLDDVWVAVPGALESTLADYGQEVATRESRRSMRRKGLEQVSRGVRSILGRG
ncbi:MAG: hypothetical protein J0L92_18480 [Deltaproteobacteria bacterium]|nr:hypothetical protein [Deltaproteobacteria bacterium]